VAGSTTGKVLASARPHDVRCTVCQHAQRGEIDEVLLDGTASIRSMGTRYAVSPWSLMRHAAAHMPALLADAHEEGLRELADTLLGHVRGHLDRARELYDAAVEILEEQREVVDGKRRTKDAPVALAAIRTATLALGRESDLLELLGRVTGELRDDTRINVVVMPEWVELRARIVAALAPYPEALEAVRAALAVEARTA
jgi:hypothetical protein